MRTESRRYCFAWDEGREKGWTGGRREGVEERGRKGRGGDEEGRWEKKEEREEEGGKERGKEEEERSEMRGGVLQLGHYDPVAMELYLEAANGEEDVLLGQLEPSALQGLEVRLIVILSEAGNLPCARHLHP